MCGICGAYDPGGAQRSDLARMLTAIAHRGPDDEGTYIDGPVALGNRRLSIIDLPGGRQPISNEDGTVRITFNGEIYNYRQLRAQLEREGHHFRSHSDTEVIVHLYEQLGEACVPALRGMFAFALWDAKKATLLLARDHLGQKPLYYAQQAGRLIFASEIKAILAAGGLQREMDLEALHHYLSLRFIPAPRTMLRGVQKLPAGHLAVFQHGDLTIRRYWDLSFQNKLGLDESAWVDALRERLIDTVDAHLLSDVPVGAYLSGGLDSSMVAAIMARDLGQTFKTFAIGVRDQDFNELPYARLAATHLGTQHHESCVQASLIQTLPTVIWHLDEPSDPIAACMFYAARLAARHVKVVLSGDGGDELFAGFDRYFGFAYAERYAAVPAIVRQRLIGPLLSRIPDSFAYKSLTQKLRWIQTLSGLNGGGERYAGATSFFRFSHDDKRALFQSEVWRQLDGLNSAAIIIEPYNRANATDPIDRMLYADIMTRLPEHSLMLTDRMTMAHGLEARAPFLDHHLMEFMAAAPSRLKIKGRTTKHILRQVARQYLPEAIVQREKQGFMFPMAYWFRGPLYPLLQAWLPDSSLVQGGFFRRGYIKRLLDEHRARRVDHHVRLWMLLNLGLWHQLYIDQTSVASIEERLRSNLSC
jgi:asparagine synthase (glutamine-hydrolysing)